MGSKETYVRTEDKTRGSEVCEGVTGSREGMSRMKTSCVAFKVTLWSILDGGIIDIMQS